MPPAEPRVMRLRCGDRRLRKAPLPRLLVVSRVVATSCPMSSTILSSDAVSVRIDDIRRVERRDPAIITVIGGWGARL